MDISNGCEVRESSGKDRGVFATTSFQPNAIVMVGAIKDVLDVNHSHASQIGEAEFVLHAGLISTVNHSCGPNCGIQVNDTGAHNFVAMRDIAIDDEITFDYAMRNYTIDHFPETCTCGADECRGSITGWKDLPDDIKSEYDGFVAPYLLTLDARVSSSDT